jgi:hypothetical protein
VSTNAPKQPSVPADRGISWPLPFPSPFSVMTLGVIWVGWSGSGRVCLALYWCGCSPSPFYRYLSHRTYKTSLVPVPVRRSQQLQHQKGAVVGAHRHHQLFRRRQTTLPTRGFLYAHMGWIFDRRNTDPYAAFDLAKFELRALNLRRSHSILRGFLPVSACCRSTRLHSALRECRCSSGFLHLDGVLAWPSPSACHLAGSGASDQRHQ